MDLREIVVRINLGARLTLALNNKLLHILTEENKYSIENPSPTICRPTQLTEVVRVGWNTEEIPICKICLKRYKNED